MHRSHHTTTTTTTRRGIFGRKHVVHHQQRKPSLGDKISGAMLKLKGSLTHRPGQKAAGTRRMHGTDGRGSHRSAHHTTTRTSRRTGRTGRYW
ncbi:hypothetical protein BKA67DRAFT_659458 [Truncatella angustata]|uniref:Uncharacterized protein n=1 Tax=Truncatella angustata TaxID=152316 RepID=A0A9P8ZVN7_9PEZI|nr:uncharacterized protein BKA67DRAFT_659458 [Truncatella angustata]KAH6652785.1 hypothetical protein BKA67DRAFT_659458 [Truncatella angustata]KAH8204694.1 hypothetical protein TruAng_001169 [Truncatella angustata]